MIMLMSSLRVWEYIMKKINKEPNFEKQLKNLVKKHYKTDKLYEFITLLQKEENLPGKYRDHALSGNLKGYRESHIDKDVLVIYQLFSESIVLVGIGTHKDLLKK